jgi:hypothetical protein
VGQNSMPITPESGSLLHAGSQILLISILLLQNMLLTPQMTEGGPYISDLIPRMAVMNSLR